MSMKRRSRRSGQNVTPKNVAATVISADVAHQSIITTTAVRANAASLLLLVGLLCGSVPVPAAAIRGALFRSGRSTTAWRPLGFSAVSANSILSPFWGGPTERQPFSSSSSNNNVKPSMVVDLHQLAQWQHKQAIMAKVVKQMLEDSRNREREDEIALGGLDDRQSEESGANLSAQKRFPIQALFDAPTRADHLTTNNKRGVMPINLPLLAQTEAEEEATADQQLLIKRAKPMQPKKRVAASRSNNDQQQQKQQKQKKQQIDHFINMAKKQLMFRYKSDSASRRRR